MWCVAGAHPSLHAHEPPPAQQHARPMENSGKAPRLVVRHLPPLEASPPHDEAADGEGDEWTQMRFPPGWQWRQ